jgi:hypothetical protein
VLAVLGEHQERLAADLLGGASIEVAAAGARAHGFTQHQANNSRKIAAVGMRVVAALTRPVVTNRVMAAQAKPWAQRCT